MYVCLCNGFTENDVRTFAQAGACATKDVYRHFGERGCGQCAGHIDTLLSGRNCENPACYGGACACAAS